MALGAIDPQLTLKITPPRIPRTMLERARLSSTRSEFTDKSVILLQTATGSGKTSLLAQWRKEALQTGAVVIWLTLDSLDNNNRFLRGLVAGTRAASGRQNFGLACLRTIETDQGSLEGVTSWLAEIAALAMDTLLVLDDAHSLPESTLNSSLVYLLLNSPPNLKIIIASRKPLALPIFDLSARGSLLALSASDLRFDATETIALLNARFGRKIDPDSCARLYEQTEGWPLGLQLAISTIERSPDLQDAIARLSTQSSEIQRYYMACLLDQLSPELSKFLVSVSFVDGLSPSLCAAISGQENATLFLSQLADQTPIFSEGIDSVWLRIHPLARELLRERFGLLPEPEQHEYRARAAYWLAEHGLNEEAARHFLEAGLQGSAFELIERALHDLVHSGQVSQVIDWIERLPKEEIERRSGLRIAVGWLRAQSERHSEAALIVSSIIHDETASPASRLESAEICATAAFFGDDLDTMDRLVSSAHYSLPGQSAMLRLVGVNQRAVLMLYRGLPDQARYGYTQLPPEYVAIGRYSLGWRDWIIGFSHLWEGQVEQGSEKLRVALAHAERDSGRRSPIAVMLASALASALLDSNQIEESAALLADRLDILERRTPPDAIIMGYLTVTRIAVLNGEEQRAFVLLDYLMALGKDRQLPRLCIASMGERIRMHALRRRGDISAVVERKLDAMLTGLGDYHWGTLEPLVRLQIAMARAYSAVARQDWIRVQQCLDAAWPDAERLRRGREALQISLLRSLAKKRCGDDGSPDLQEALSMAKLWGFPRIVADTHPHLVDWAKEMQSVTSGDIELQAPEANTQLNEKLPPKTRDVPEFRVTVSSLLSPKERKVLQLLAGNLSNKQIGLAMGVSDETIKWHLKNLYGKLNAGGRKHLIDRAHMLGLLEPAR